MRLRTQKAHLGTDDKPLPIIPGMTAGVEILTGRKTVLDYLLKPIEPKRLADAIQKLEQSEDRSELSAGEGQIVNRGSLGENDQVFVKDGEKCWFVKLADVRLFESEGNYVRLYFGSSKPLILRSLNYLDERLNNKTFFKERIIMMIQER